MIHMYMDTSYHTICIIMYLHMYIHVHVAIAKSAEKIAALGLYVATVPISTMWNSIIITHALVSPDREPSVRKTS